MSTSLSNNSRSINYLKDYKPAVFLVSEVELLFELDEVSTIVTSTLSIQKNSNIADVDNQLQLYGKDLHLLSIAIDGKELNDSAYQVLSDSIVLNVNKADFTLTSKVKINPSANKSLNGLYVSNGNFATQCEPNGFRAITYFPDRPDILSRFSTKIIASKEQYPCLLSNGNLVASGDLADGKHWVKWHDISLKPCYLFALVAGKLDCLSDNFTTMSGRKVALKIYVEIGKLAQADFAMYSLKQSMLWDENVFSREYDLDIYMIVAVSDFNFGAMENKGLNIFNDQYVLASQNLATDQDYTNVLGVIGHEYFHNWSGNRVTLRDWFQLSLKEGLTIFRDQSFTADLTSPLSKRIADVNIMRAVQFAEDAGPMAHAVRPASYVAMNNFYTTTVYNKGAELIRMIKVIIGAQNFANGMNHYFTKFDGMAVTTDDFVDAMAYVSKLDLTQFKRWYKQVGTPHVAMKTTYDEEQQRFTIILSQSIHGKNDYAPLHIPLRFGLFDVSNGNELELYLEGHAEDTLNVMHLTDISQQFVFNNIVSKPIVSILRDFSAPIILDYAYSEDELVFLLKNDTDLFSRWDAASTIIKGHIKQGYSTKLAGENLANLSDSVVTALEFCLISHKDNAEILVQMFTMPPMKQLLTSIPSCHVDILQEVYQELRLFIARQFKQQWLDLYAYYNDDSAYEFTASAVISRALKNISLNYLSLLDIEEVHIILQRQFVNADNMTDKFAALTAAMNCGDNISSPMLASFYTQYQDYPLVLDKWFRLQATTYKPDSLARIKSLIGHSSYDCHNPNKVRAVLGGFATINLAAFHASGGDAYKLLADQIIATDSFNPQLAATLCSSLASWQLYDEKRRSLMRNSLEDILAIAELSDDLYEVVSKSLDFKG